MQNLESVRRISSDIYLQMAKEKLGIDFTSLPTKKVRELVTVPYQDKIVREYGLHEDNVAIYLQEFNRHSVKDSSYSITTLPKKGAPVDEGYCITFDEGAIHAAEEAIQKSDLLKAIGYGLIEAEHVIEQRLKHGITTNENKIEDLARGYAENKLKERKRVWKIINEGLERLLIGDIKKDRIILQDAQLTTLKITQVRKQGTVHTLALHGHQLMELVRQKKYAFLPKRPSIVFIGHYHLQMVTIRFGTWIVFTGHWLLKPMIPNRFPGILSHLGSAAVGFTSEGPQTFETRRYNERVETR